MIGLVFIILAMAGVSFALWVSQTAKALEFSRCQVNEAWEDLRKALMVRREMVPYIVAAVHADNSQLLDVIGNACDLADHVATVQECSKAEARLTSVLNRLFAAMDAERDSGGRETLDNLRGKLDEQTARIMMHKEIYNRQAETLNTLLERGAARLFVTLGVYRQVDVY